ncbi:MAG: hypothetical protein IJC56_03740 [Clostridia bacterium]|nr:hypothetical protein [Clostridia bacterium]
MTQFIKGVAYHGNRMLSHVREDMREIASAGFNTILHTYSHNDLDRNRRTMKDIFEITFEYGMDVWADNWGLGGPPGDKSHFLSYHPEAHQIGSDGLPDPVRACYNAPSFVQFTKDWVDAVYEAGARKIFWDEPHLVGTVKDGVRVFTCRCENCRRLFEERYGHAMPAIMTPEVDAFRKWTITNYFQSVAAYAKAKGMYNTVCVMFANGENAPDHGVDLDSICATPSLDNIGSDPYWLGQAHGYTEVYRFVYERARHNIELCESLGKDHNLWLQTYSNPADNEDEIIAAADALYDAGARSIFAWGYMGSDSTDYRAIAPERTWYATKAAFERISNRHRDDMRRAARAALGLEQEA